MTPRFLIQHSVVSELTSQCSFLSSLYHRHPITFLFSSLSLLVTKNRIEFCKNPNIILVSFVDQRIGEYVESLNLTDKQAETFILTDVWIMNAYFTGQDWPLLLSGALTLCGTHSISMVTRKYAASQTQTNNQPFLKAWSTHTSSLSFNHAWDYKSGDRERYQLRQFGHA